MSIFDLFRRAEKEVEIVKDEVVSIISGPVVSELMMVTDKIIANSSNPVVLLALAEVGVTPVEVIALVKVLQAMKTLVMKTEIVLEQKAAAAMAAQATL